MALLILALSDTVKFLNFPISSPIFLSILAKSRASAFMKLVLQVEKVSLTQRKEGHLADLNRFMINLFKIIFMLDKACLYILEISFPSLNIKQLRKSERPSFLRKGAVF